MCLFSDRSHDIKMWEEQKSRTQASRQASLVFLPCFDIFCDLLLDRCMAIWNLFVLYNAEVKKLTVIYASRHVELS